MAIKRKAPIKPVYYIVDNVKNNIALEKIPAVGTVHENGAITLEVIVAQRTVEGTILNTILHSDELKIKDLDKTLFNAFGRRGYRYYSSTLRVHGNSVSLIAD